MTEGSGAARPELAAVDPETMELALALARAMKGTRGTSRFAVDTFVRAIEHGDILAARLEMTYSKREGRVEATIHVGPEVVR